MARPLRITFPGAFYHITSRGNEGGAFKIHSFESGKGWDGGKAGSIPMVELSVLSWKGKSTEVAS